ncbi:MAG: MBL fold metallo-hydrolase, partial [Ileibacterium sp.]|nr:MBL fold metallo-hydrolase [Ileibacterium sp.]
DVYMNPSEFDFLYDPKKNSSAAFMGFPPLKLSAKPLPLKEGSQKIGSFEVNAWYAPGHSIGSTIIQIGDCLFTGDVLFAGSIGRTDLATGNADQMRQSLNYLKDLTKNYEVYPGHGPATTLDYEKAHNPYLIYSLI